MVRNMDIKANSNGWKQDYTEIFHSLLVVKHADSLSFAMANQVCLVFILSSS